MAKLGPDCFEAKNAMPFELYREYSNGLTRGIEYEFQQLSNYANHYKEMKENTEIRHHMQFYDHLKLPRLEAFILFVYYKSRWCVGEVCNSLESFIVRRLLCYNGEYSYEHINTFFSQAIQKNDFILDEFKTFVFTHEPYEDEMMNAFKDASSKDAELISYVFYRIENRNKKETERWPSERLNLENQMTRLSKIQENLEKINADKSNLTTLSKAFNDVWTPIKPYSS